MKGHLADQKSVLVSQHVVSAVLASFLPMENEDIHATVGRWACVPYVSTEWDGATDIADTDSSLAGAIEKASGRYDAKVNIQHGRAHHQ